MFALLTQFKTQVLRIANWLVTHMRMMGFHNCHTTKFSLSQSLSLSLNELLLAASREVQQPPSSARVELCLVPTQRPHIGDSHHLVLATLNDLPLSVLDTNDLLAVEGQDQHGALLHHLTRKEVDTVNICKTSYEIQRFTLHI